MFYKMIFNLGIIITAMLSITTNSWLVLWISLEMNLLFIIPLMNNKLNLNSMEVSMKYFLVQSIASTLMMFSIIYFSKFNMSFLMTLAVLLKMGMAPFHFWYPEVLSGLSWYCCFLMMTIQKIPLISIIIFLNNNSLIYFTIVMSTLISVLQSLNQNSLRKILSYSSMNHMSWIILNNFYSKFNMIWYFIIYTLVLLIFIVLLKLMNLFYLNQLSIQYNYYLKFSFFINLMSLGGLPPLLGFFPKWITIQYLSMNWLLMIFMSILSLIMLYVYMRIFFNSLMLINMKQINLFSFNKMKVNFLNMFSLSLLIFCLLIFNL